LFRGFVFPQPFILSIPDQYFPSLLSKAFEIADGLAFLHFNFRNNSAALPTIFHRIGFVFEYQLLSPAFPARPRSKMPKRVSERAE
jgi:hypothetical protein